MKHLWNFLALWAGTVLTVFIAYEVFEAIKAIIASASKAFGIATDWHNCVLYDNFNHCNNYHGNSNP